MDLKPTEQMRAQYEAYPYPERDPKDEAKRLITGSPSWPQEMDHVLWSGARDWSHPLRVLVAGGGTGDGLIQLAATLTAAKRPYEVTYVDLSKASRQIAEGRVAARGLKNISFHTESLLKATDFGEFDYIDCCGVLHHLPEPQFGFDALAAALAPGGGIGLMVYAPLGRSGVYPLQDAFNAISGGLAPQDKLALAKEVFAKIPEGHPFKRNLHLVDHNASDAGFYDLLLHSSDRAFRIAQLIDALNAAGLELAGFPEPALYDPSDLVPANALDALNKVEQMQLAENLRGTLKTHIVYATLKGQTKAPPLGRPDAVPHLKGVAGRKLAQVISKVGQITITSGGAKHVLPLPTASAPLVARVDGRRDLAALREAAKLDPIQFGALWGPVEQGLCAHGLLHYSKLFVS